MFVFTFISQSSAKPEMICKKRTLVKFMFLIFTLHKLQTCLSLPIMRHVLETKDVNTSLHLDNTHQALGSVKSLLKRQLIGVNVSKMKLLSRNQRSPDNRSGRQNRSVKYWRGKRWGKRRLMCIYMDKTKRKCLRYAMMGLWSG